jgi:hypothetical protein
MLALKHPVPEEGRFPGLPGLLFLAMASTLLVAPSPASKAATLTAIQFEAEDFVTSWNAGGDPIRVVSCSGARGYLAVDGVDFAGDYVEWDVHLPAEYTFRDSLRTAGATGLVRKFIVQFYPGAGGPAVLSDTLTTLPGAGVG